MGGNDKFRCYIRIIAGGYVIYLTAQVLKELYNGNVTKHAVPLTIAAIALIAVSIPLIVFGVKKLMAIQKEERAEAEKYAQEEARAQKQRLMSNFDNSAAAEGEEEEIVVVETPEDDSVKENTEEE